MRHVKLQEVSHNKSDMAEIFSKPLDLPVNKWRPLNALLAKGDVLC